MSELVTCAASLIMPKLGLTMSEGLIAEWLVRPGDDVVAGQILFIVETDKISNEIEAPAQGRIVEIIAGQGESVGVGRPVALWTGPDQSAERIEDSPIDSFGEGKIRTAVDSHGDVPKRRILSTPFARRLARQAGIDIARLHGSGSYGRIRARDVQAAMDAQPAPAMPPVPTHRPGRNLRQLIAARVSRSKAEIPHFYLTADVQFDTLEKLRKSLNADPGKSRKLSVTAFIAMAAGRALRAMPEANVVWRQDHSESLSSVAVGIAVDTPDGVLVPVLTIAGGIYDFAEALDLAAKRVRTARLSAADVGEAALGISNVGMYRIRSLTPVIDPDQSFMLGVGAPQAVFRPGSNGAPVACEEITLCLACDHRAIDGAAAARFLATIVDFLENPGRLLVA